jgi:hypothetical protein
MKDKPIPESYWVIPTRFLAGEYPGLSFDLVGTRQRLAAFLAAGFDTFIDLTCEGERADYLRLLKGEAKAAGQPIQYQRLSFPDFKVPTHTRMTAALDAIDSALADDHKVYLHCVGGIGRTGTTVGCWLVRHGMVPADALRQVGNLYHDALQSNFMHRSPETEEQAKFILNWTEDGLA